jgi:hypothetical protein
MGEGSIDGNPNRTWEKGPDGISLANFINLILPNNITIISFVDSPTNIDVTFVVPSFYCS